MICSLYKYRMLRIHVISDLFLEYNEFTPIEDTIIPDVDLVIINGNIGHLKRGMLYADELCKKYPNIEFVYNFGETERFLGVQQKYDNELLDSMKVRVDNNPLWPKNLHWSTDPIQLTLGNGREVDILCTYGFPKIHKSNIPWEETSWFRDYALSVTIDHDLFRSENASVVYHGTHSVWATMDAINNQHIIENNTVKKWELNKTSLKILVTHINPLRDTRCEGTEHSPFRIHLLDGLWIASNTLTENVKLVGARLEANPGRGSVARSKIIFVD